MGSIGQAYWETKANAGIGFVVYNDDCCLRSLFTRKYVVMVCTLDSSASRDLLKVSRISSRPHRSVGRFSEDCLCLC